jgi:hypothetical protein
VRLLPHRNSDGLIARGRVVFLWSRLPTNFPNQGSEYGDGASRFAIMPKFSSPQWIIGGLAVAAFLLVALSTAPH